MKTIGLVGGMSWESTVPYYRVINETIRDELGGFNSSKCIMHSLNFHEIEQHQSKGLWDKSAEAIGDAAKKLEGAGADMVLICSNSMNKTAEDVEKHIGIPLLHIATPTIEKLKQCDIKRVGLLGTKYTMQQDFIKSKIKDAGIDVIIPNEQDMDIVHSVIYDELCVGKINEDSRKKYIEIIERLAKSKAEGVVLGCTEIGLLINQSHTNVPVFDTTELHARKAAMLSITEELQQRDNAIGV